MNQAPSKIVLKIGEKFSFQCDGNLTTGYDWLIKNDNPKIVAIDKKIFTNTPDFVGNRNTIIFEISGISNGKTNLLFTYQKPWETDVKPVDKIEMEVIVGS